MKLKVCGLRHEENIKAIMDTVQPDYAGFIFYEKSPRHITDEDMQQLVDENIVPDTVKKVGVFVNEDMAVMEEKAEKFKLDCLQLHGHEPAKLCETLKNKGYEIIKAFSLELKFDFDLLLDYMPYVDFFLFDTKGASYGGNGYSFDWDILKSYDQKVPFFLSGGIGLHNIEEVKDYLDMNIHALDVNSKFESSPGQKNVPALQELKTIVNKFEK